MDFYDKIEDYKHNRLSPEERDAFEAAMKEDTHLASAVKHHQAIGEVKDYLEEQDIRSTLQSLKKERLKTIAVKRTRRLMIGVAAGFLLLILGLSFLWRIGDGQKSYTSTGELFDAYFEPYKAGTLRSEEESFKTQFQEGMKAYIQGDFEKVILLFSQMNSEAPSFLAASFYLGNAYLKTDNPALAINAFREVIQKEDPRFLQPAEWYSALAYLRSGDKQQAKQLLQQISQKENHSYQQKAQDILNASF